MSHNEIMSHHETTWDHHHTTTPSHINRWPCRGLLVSCSLVMWWLSDVIWWCDVVSLCDGDLTLSELQKFLLYEQAVVVYSEYIKYSIDISFVCVSVRLFVLSNWLWSNVPKYRDAPIFACVVDCWLYTIWMCLCVSAMVCLSESGQ